MRILDPKFNQNKASYFLQSLLATLAIFVVLILLDARTNSAVIAALGASSFIAFTMPHAELSQPKFLIGSYLLGIISAGICYYLSILPFIKQIPFVSDFSCIIFGSIAVGLVIFLMVITNTEHPPAASLALGLVFNLFNLKSVFIVFSGIVCLSIIKAILKPVLKDLI
ncbi:MAG: HPP family protein [Candidatus Omnitrophota bacterium]